PGAGAAGLPRGRRRPGARGLFHPAGDSHQLHRAAPGRGDAAPLPRRRADPAPAADRAAAAAGSPGPRGRATGLQSWLAGASLVARRRNHWGWGYEDELPSPDEVRAAAAGIAPALGFGSTDVEDPVPLEAVELPAPRIEPPP